MGIEKTHLATSEGEHQRAGRQRAVVGDQQLVWCTAAVQDGGAGDQADGVERQATGRGCGSHHVYAGHRRHAAEGEHPCATVQVTKQQLRMLHHGAVSRTEHARGKLVCAP